MIADFATVMVEPQRVRCLGVQLRPLSLGHVLVLRVLGNSFVTDAPTAMDLPVAAFVLAHGWRENLRKLRRPGRVGRLMRWWGFLTRRMNKGEEARALHAYIAEQMALPELKRERGVGVRYLVSEWETRVFMHLRTLGYSDEQALDMPLARAHLLMVAKLEQDGACNFKSRYELALDRAKLDLLERMERGEIAG